MADTATPPYGAGAPEPLPPAPRRAVEEPVTSPLAVAPVDPLSGPIHLVEQVPSLFEPTTTLEPFPPPDLFAPSITPAPSAWPDLPVPPRARAAPGSAGRSPHDLFEPAVAPAVPADDTITLPHGIPGAVGSDEPVSAPPARPEPSPLVMTEPGDEPVDAPAEPTADGPSVDEGPADDGPSVDEGPADKSPVDEDRAATEPVDADRADGDRADGDRADGDPVGEVGDRPAANVDWVTAALPVVALPVVALPVVAGPAPAPGPEPAGPAPAPGDGAAAASAPSSTATPVPWLPGPQARPDPPAAPAPAVPPVTVPAATGGDARHGDPWPRRLGRTVLDLVGGAAVARELTDLAAGVQRPVPTGRRIAVVGPRGGAGRSTVAALLGCVYAARRADLVLVADAEPALGSLAWRLSAELDGDPAALGARLLAAGDGSSDEVAALLPAGPAGLRVLPGGTGATAEITRALARSFAVTVIDGGGPPDPDVHAAVLVTPATADGIRTSAAVLRRWKGGAVVALVDRDRGVRPPLADLARFDVPVVRLPHDRHLAAGIPIRPDRLAAATRREVTRLAGLALEAALRSDR